MRIVRGAMNRNPVSYTHLDVYKRQLPAILVQTITPILVREKECDSYSYEAKKRTFVGITTWVSPVSYTHLK